MCVFPFTAQAREHFGRKTESVDYIAVVRITITITITITMLRSAPRRIVTGPQPDAMMPSTMIRTTRHDTSRQVAFASCFMRRWRDQLPVAGSSEINSLTRRSMDRDLPPMMQNPGRYDYDYDYDYGRNYVTLRYVTVSGPRLLVTQPLWYTTDRNNIVLSS